MELLLERYARFTDVQPAPDLSRRIAMRIAAEPARTPPRRFLAALGAFRLARARDAFAQTAGVAFGRGRFPALVRAQALGLVVLAVGTVGVAGIAGAVGVTQVIDRFQDQQVVVEREDEAPSPSLSVEPSPSPSESPGAPAPSPSTSPEPSESPEPSDAPPTDARETDDSSGPGVRRTAEPTERAATTPGSDDKATPRPARTAKPTAKPTPRETRRPRLTPKPTRRPSPEPEDTDEPRETEEPDDPAESEAPDDDNSGPGKDGSGTTAVLVAVGPVLLFIPA